MNDDRQRDEGGKYTEEISLNDALAVFEEVEIPVLTSNDVADHLGCSRASAYNKLETLSDEGELIKKNVGAKGCVYILWDD
jgi:CTP-dependent riboflavin kinase